MLECILISATVVSHIHVVRYIDCTFLGLQPVRNIICNHIDYYYIGAIVQPAANHLRESYIKSRFYYAPNEWPPYHPKHYTTLALIHHKGKRVNTEVISVTQELVTEGNLSRSHPLNGNISYYSKDISELFPTNLISSYFLLIEGAPGIGKTVLCKEIAYQWAEKKLLKFKKLVFLLFLQDPTIKQLMSLESLIQYFFESTKIASDLSEYFFHTKGKGLVFIFDGYDEMSEEDRNNSLVAKIISRNVLPECDLVITSRPSASLCLRDVADCRVEVLGFTEEDRLDYIQHALKGSTDKIEALQFYLQSNSTINALCYVPLNMTILLCLFEEVECLSHSTLDLDNKEDIELPNTQTEMYEKFILMTITRFIKKSNKTFSGKCLTFFDLPEPYNEAFNELLHLAYNALINDQMVFSLNDEIVQDCPILKCGKYGGLGLLKVTEYVSNVSFHFLHFSIQESLAAYYIASQSSSFQVQLLRDTFWDIHYFNTWIMYVGMTGGKKIAWKHFISGNRFMLSTKVFKSSKISKRYLNDKIKSLHLFQCFAEIGNKLVGKVFKDKVIDLSNQTLLPRDINTICFFLLRSVNKYWIKLDLSNCNIGETGSDILCKTFLDKSRNIVGIDKVDLSHNQLQGHSILGLLDVFKVWHTSQAVISGNYGNDGNLFELCLNKFALCNDEDFSQIVIIGPFIFAYNIHIYNQLINSTSIATGVYLNHCNYPSTNFAYEELSHKLILSKLHIIGENIVSIKAIFQTLKEIDSVYIYDHTLSDEDVKYISSTICKINPSNFGIWVVIGKTKMLGNIPDMFTINKQFSPIEISNLTESIKRLCSTSDMSTTKFNKYTENKTVCEDFFQLLHKNISKCEIKFCLIKNDILIANGVKCNDLSKVLLSSNNKLVSIFITKCKLNVTELKMITNLIIQQESLEKLYIFDSLLEMDGFNCENLLNQTFKVKQLFIHSTDSSCSLTFDLLEAQRIYSNASVLLITNDTLIGHNPTCEQILLSLQLEANLTVWKICNFPKNIELFQHHTLSNVVELDIIGCHIGEYDFQRCNNYSNHSYYRISKQTIDHDSLCRLLTYFTELKAFNLRYSNLQEAVAGKIFKDLSISNLTRLNISHNEIDEQAVDDIAKLLSQIFKLQELDLSYNNLQVTEAVNLLKELQNISSFSISNNGLNDKAAHGIATFLSHNPQLKVFDLGYNNLQAAGAIVICKEMSNLVSLAKLNLSNNNISDEAADDIATVLFQYISLEELDLSYNNLGALGSLHIIRNMIKMSNLIKLNICSIGITEIAADDIVTILNNNTKMKELDLSYNNIKTTGATILFKNTSIVNLHKFNISHNNITDDVDYIEGFISMNTNLEELDLSHNNLQASGAIKVCKANLAKLTSFNISHNNIAYDATNDIGTFLSHNTKLQMLDISGNNLQELGYIFKSVMSNLTSLNVSHSSVINEVADELATFLLQNTCLQGIDLSYSNLSTSGAVKIFKGMENTSNLKIINISHNMITDEAGDTLANVLLNNIRLKDINLSYNNLSSSGTVCIFKGMKSISNLETIDISHNMITDEAAENIANVLSHNNKLQSLDLSSDNFKYEGLFKIFYCLNVIYLRRLNISCNKINATTANIIATVLSRNLKLEELDLGNNLMQAASTVTIFKSLRHHLNLKKVYINDNMITDEAAEEIAVVLSQNMKLEELDISCNNMQTTGIIKLFEGIEHISTLTKLNIAHNSITDEAAKYIMDGLSSNSTLKEINLSHINLKNTIAYKNLKLANLNKFNFSGNIINEKLTNEISRFLSHCTNLKVLDLSCTNLQNLGCIEILNRLDIFNLTTFNISGNNITTHAADAIAVLLSKNDDLEELDLSCNNLQESGIRNILDSMNILNLNILNISNNHVTGHLKYIGDTLTHATKLVELDLSHNSFHAESMQNFLYEMKSIFANLVKLNVSGSVISAEVTEALGDVLLENTKLKELDLSYNNLHGEGIKNIFNGLKISTLIKFNISHNNITCLVADYVAYFLSRNTKLEQLDLSHNNLEAAGAIKICGTGLTNLSTFNISHNGITAEAEDEIAAFLSGNTKLQILDLSCNSSMIILKVLPHTPVLSSLKISDCNVIDEATDKLGNILLHNTLLQELDLSYNSLSLRILKGMKNILNLVTLNVSHNEIIDEAADELANVLLHNTSLQELDLSYNSLSKLDSLSILKGMKNISSLIKINVSHNEIIDEAADKLTNILLQSTSLQELDLSYSSLSKLDSLRIFKGMKNISSLIKINVSHNEIIDEAADELANVLLHNTLLQELDLSYNSLSKLDSLRILKGMKNISSLIKINVSHNEIVDEAADELVSVLLQNTSLQELDLSYNNLSKLDSLSILKGMKNISSLVKINVSHNKIIDEAADELASVLLHNTLLQELDLSYNSLSKLDSLRILKGMKNISSLIKINVSHNEIIDEAADELASVLLHNTLLQEFDLSYNSLSKLDSLRILKGMKNISSLIKINVSHNEITDETADELANVLLNNTLLQELDLSYNSLSKLDSLRILRGMKNTSSLIKINVSHNEITDEAADELANVLLNNTSLQELDLSYNSLSDSLRILKGMKSISSLIRLNISHNEIIDEAADELANVLLHNTLLQEIDLSYNSLSELDSLRILQGIKNITSLVKINVSHNEIIDEAADELANVLLHNTLLQELDLSYNGLSKLDSLSILKGMKNISSLVKINVSHNEIIDEAADELASVLFHNTLLQELNLSYNSLSKLDSLRIFKSMKNISSLIKINVSHNEIIDEAAKELVNILLQNTSLQQLDLSYNSLSKLDSLSILKGMKNISSLVKINVSHNKIIDEAADELGNVLLHNTLLQELDLSYNSLSKLDSLSILKGMKNISSLATLNVSHNEIIDKAADELVSVLLQNTSLQELDLSYNSLSKLDSLSILKGMKNISSLIKINVSHSKIIDEAADELASVLFHNTLLQELDLSYNSLSKLDSLRILKGMKNISSLVTLNLSHNKIIDEAADELASVLFHNTLLQEIDLSYNSLSKLDSLRILRGMKNISSLITINVSHNEIIDEAADELANILLHNTSLQEIDLSYNSLSKLDSLRILRGMKNISTLITINVSHNEIIDEAADKLAYVLLNNASLQEIDLSYNSLSKLDSLRIFKGMKNTSSLIAINVSHNEIIDEAADELAFVLLNNSLLQELDLSYNSLSDSLRILKGLKNISSLVTLNVSHNEIIEEAADELANVLLNNTSLQELNLSYNSLSKLDSLRILKAMKNISSLVKINISHSKIIDEAADELANVLVHNTLLQELDLSYNGLSKLDSLRILKGMKNISSLVTLNVSHNKIIDEAADELANVLLHNTSLQELDFSYNSLSKLDSLRILKGMINISSLVKINVSHNEIIDEAADEFANVLLHNILLQELDLSCNSLLKLDSLRILKGMKNISSLVTLNVSHNEIIDEAADELANVLLHNTSLQELDFNYNSLSKLDSLRILKGMTNISSLVKINVSHNEIIDEAADELANVLLHNSLLQELDLSYNSLKNISSLATINVSHNKIIDEAADELATFLPCRVSLQELDMSCNNLLTLDIFKGMNNISNLVSLNISHNIITDEAADELATDLSHNINLEILNMSFNYLTPKGCIEIFSGMRNCFYLRILDISYNNITFEATGNIAAVLSHNRRLEELDISYNNLQTPGAMKIFQSIKHISTLTKLNIAHNMISDEATEYIIDILCNNSRLKKCNLSHNSLLEKDVIKKMIISKKFNSIYQKTTKKLSILITNIHELDLYNVNLRTDGATEVLNELNYISSLTKFNISGNSITPMVADILANFLSKNVKLQELDLSHNDLQVSGINRILSATKCSNLTTLNISANNVNLQSAVEILSCATNLVELDLSYNKVNNAVGITSFFSKLKIFFVNLIKFNMSGICREMNNEAAEILADTFSQNIKLKELDISDNNLYSEAISKVLSKLNTSVLIKFNSNHNNITDEVADDIAVFLSKCTKLEVLDLSHNNLQDAGGIKICRTNISTLISFDISHNNITIRAADDTANFLSYNSQMERFYLSCNGLLEVGVRNIFKDMPVTQSIFNLSVLNISNSGVINKAINELTTILADNTKLMELDLSYNNLSTRNAIKIFNRMKNILNLVRFNISHNMITDKAVDELATILSNNNRLMVFDMSSNYFSSEGCIKVINGMKNILHLKKFNTSYNDISYEAADSIATLLSHNFELEELVLSCINLYETALLKRIKIMKLTKLDISDNNLTYIAADEIVIILMHNTELEDIDLSNNKLLSDGTITIFNGMKKILKLKRINISENWITFEAADDIANVLSQNTNLQELYLGNNYLQASGITTLLSKMSNISKVTHLDISSNKINDEAADDIATFILHNDNLKVIDLSNNLIQATGFTKIFGRTSTNFCLKKVNLSENVLDDEAADTIAAFLSQNILLEELDLSKNYLQSVGAVRIFGAIKNHPNILKLNMSDNRITNEAADAILSTLQTLQEVNLESNMLSLDLLDYVKKILKITRN